MATEERIVRLENAVATLAELASKHHERVSTLEQSFQMLVQLARSADERLEQQLSWINQLGEAQANTEVKMAALTDAQIKMDEALSRLAESQARLAESQTHSDQRLDALIDIVREWRNGKS
jgi:chromosome segregation ATPase